MYSECCICVPDVHKNTGQDLLFLTVETQNIKKIHRRSFAELVTTSWQTDLVNSSEGREGGDWLCPGNILLWMQHLTLISKRQLLNNIMYIVWENNPDAVEYGAIERIWSHSDSFHYSLLVSVYLAPCWINQWTCQAASTCSLDADLPPFPYIHLIWKILREPTLFQEKL